MRHRRAAANIPAARADNLIPIANAGCHDPDQHLVVGEGTWRRHIDHLDIATDVSNPGYEHLNQVKAAMRQTLRRQFAMEVSSTPPSRLYRPVYWSLARANARRAVLGAPRRPFATRLRLPQL